MVSTQQYFCPAFLFFPKFSDCKQGSGPRGTICSFKEALASGLGLRPGRHGLEAQALAWRPGDLEALTWVSWPRGPGLGALDWWPWSGGPRLVTLVWGPWYWALAWGPWPGLLAWGYWPGNPGLGSLA